MWLWHLSGLSCAQFCSSSKLMSQWSVLVSARLWYLGGKLSWSAYLAVPETSECLPCISRVLHSGYNCNIWLREFVLQPATKLQTHHILARRYPEFLVDCPAVYPKETITVELLSGDVDGGDDRALGDMTGNPDLGSRTSICLNCSRLWEACSVVSASVPTLREDERRLTIWRVQYWCRVSNIEVCVGALVPTTASK